MDGNDLSALIDRMIPLFVEKLKNTGHVPLSDEWWKVVVGTCIADTSLALGDPEFIERWENET